MDCSPGPSNPMNKKRDPVLDSDSDTDSSISGGQNIVPSTSARADLAQATRDELVEVLRESHPGKKKSRPVPTISNSDILMAIKGLEGRLKNIETVLNQVVAKQNEMLQSTPSFITSGRSGRLVRTPRYGESEFVRY